MLPADLAKRNLRRNLRDYAAYFSCLVFVVVAFYSFSSLRENPQFLAASTSSSRISAMFMVSSIIVAVFGFVFTWIASGFFLKRRSKEIATYSLLGLRRGETARLLFLESAVVGIFALGAGLVLGGLLARLEAMALASLMRLPIEVRFVLAPRAVLITSVVFLAIFFLSAARSYVAVRRARLVDLFKAEKDAERPPRLVLPLSIAALLFLGAGYGVALSADLRGVIRFMLPVLGATILGTYCLFSGLAPGLLSLARRDRRRWLSGPRLVAYSQLGFRLRRNSRLLATIAVLDAVAMSSVATTASIYATGYQQITEASEFTYEYESADPALLEKAAAIVREEGRSVLSAERFALLRAELEGAPPTAEAREFGEKDGPFKGHLMRRSDYARRLAVRGEAAPPELAPGQAIAVDLAYGEDTRMRDWSSSVTARLGAVPRPFVVVLVHRDPPISFEKAKPLLVLEDGEWERAAAALGPAARAEISGLVLDRPRDGAALTERLKAELGPGAANFIAYSDHERDFYETSGMMLFIGVFLCLVFFLAACALIGFKQLIDARDDGRRYALLRKLGMSPEDGKRSVALQLRVVFGLPLLVGVAHTAFAMRMLSELLDGSILPAVLATTGAYLLFSAFFYRATLTSYLRALVRVEPERRS